MSPLIISTSKNLWQLPTRSKHTRYTSLVLASSPILSISVLHSRVSISRKNLEIYPSHVIFPALYSFSISHEGDSTLPALLVTSMITAPGFIFFTLATLARYVSFKLILDHELSNYR